MTRIRFIFIFGLTFIIRNTLMAQVYQPFIDVLNREVPAEVMEQKIDSFFQLNANILNQSELAECYHDRGGRWHYNNYKVSRNREDLDKAIYFTKKALALKRNLNPDKMCSINRTLFNLGLFHYHKGLPDTALSYFIDVTRNGSSYCADDNRADFLIDLAYRFAAKTYLEIGDYHEAMILLDHMIERLEQNPNINDDRPFWAYFRMAEIYMAMDLFSNSELIGFYLSKAQKYIDKKEFDCCDYQNRIDQLDGNRLSVIGKYQLSIQKHQRVVNNLENYDSIQLAIAHNSLGQSYFKNGDNDKAMHHLNQAIKYNLYYDSPHNNLGDIYLTQGLYPEALQSYQRAVDRAIDKHLNLPYHQLPTIEQIRQAPLKAELLNHLIFKTKGWIAYYEQNKNPEELKKALETIDLADHLVDIIRQESHEIKSKLFWREQGSELYGQAVKLSFLLNDAQKAYHFMERNKALLLLEDLTHQEAKSLARLPQNLSQKEYNLKHNIFLAENELYETDGDNKNAVDTIRVLVRESKYIYQEFMDSLHSNFPDYAKFKRGDKVLAFKDLKTNYVSGNRAVLHYILNEEQGYGLLTLPDTTLLFQMSDIPMLNKDVDTLIAALSDGVSDIGTFRKVSNSVFGQLLPNNIYDKIKGKQLLIIPDYTLQRVPFEALVLNHKAELKYLIEEVEISYAYSMSLLNQTKGKEKNAPNDLVAFAPVQFDEMGLPQLYFSENEITSISDMYPGKAFLNGKASKASFIENIDQHNIVHLATHADIGDEENPWIAFSDSKMYLKEIYATRNQADMVVLSACNTSNGELKRGEGVMSLARGFFYSGAKSVVSTLWPVADEAGKDILIDFYKNLNKGDSKSEALRKSKLDYLKTTEEVELKHPYYWAGFIVLGENAPIVEISYGYWVLLVTGILVLVFLLFRGKLFKGIQ